MNLLLRAILDEPNSDEPRLIYSDYLEENGDLDRAEFIRLQLKTQWDIGVLKAWWDREKELLAKEGPPVLGTRSRMRNGGEYTTHAYRWMSLGVIAVEWCEFRRGFVEEIVCTAKDLEYLPGILECDPVQKVTLTTWPRMAVWYEEDENSQDPNIVMMAMKRQLKRQYPKIKEWDLPFPTEQFPLGEEYTEAYERMYNDLLESFRLPSSLVGGNNPS